MPLSHTRRQYRPIFTRLQHHQGCEMHLQKATAMGTAQSMSAYLQHPDCQRTQSAACRQRGRACRGVWLACANLSPVSQSIRLSQAEWSHLPSFSIDISEAFSRHSPTSFRRGISMTWRCTMLSAFRSLGSSAPCASKIKETRTHTSHSSGGRRARGSRATASSDTGLAISC